MEELVNRIIEVEWISQSILHGFNKLGPSIHLVRKRNFLTNSSLSGKEDHLLIIQGSFDPPLKSHTQLIKQALMEYQSRFPEENVKLLILLSLSHIEKRPNLLSHSTLGLRVVMLERLLDSLGLKVPWMIGISNVARYIDVTKAIKKLSSEDVIITYIMGLDVFDKLFNQKYYSKDLDEVLPEIFQVNYFVAGRDEVFKKEEFQKYLKTLGKSYQQMINESVTFISLPEELRFISSTEVRNILSQNPSTDVPSIHPVIKDFLQTVQPYSLNSPYNVKQIIIQICANLAIKNGLSSEKCMERTLYFINEFKLNSKLQIQILKEYKNKNNFLLTERCQQYLNQPS